jgi:hypothetical protein
LALASLLVLSGSASADSFYFASPGSTTWNGVYVNAYSANDISRNQNSLAIYCDDWNTDFSGNPTWNANVYALTPGNVSHFRFGNTPQDYNLTLNSGSLGYGLSPSLSPHDIYDRYLEAAWLDQQWQNAVANGTGTRDLQIELAAAEWSLFVDGAHVGGLIGSINSSGYAAAVYNDLEAAQNAVAGGYDAADWEVIVPEGNTFDMQEFLTDPPSIPEPSALILLGTVAGILGLTKLRRKRRV